MRNSRVSFKSVIIALGLIVAGALVYSQAPAIPKTLNLEERKTMWKQVEESVSQGLPKTAIEKLQTIYDSAMQEKAYPEATKAIAYRIVLEGQIQGGAPAERIKRMQSAIEDAPAEMKPMLHALQGSWYWSYFQQHRWQFARRTATASAPSDDFTTWDLPRLFLEIDKEYSEALKDEATLKSIPIANWNGLIAAGTVPDSYRPTVFDFLAHHAIEFYAAGEQAGTARQDAFEIDASSAAFGTVDEFLAWKPTTKDDQSPKLKGIRLYQNLLFFHRNDADQSAFLDAEISRLQFVYNSSVGDEKRDRYEAALKRFADQHAKHELSALARARWAQLLVDQQDMVTAREIAQQGKNAFPRSIGGIECNNIISNIEQPSVSLQTERIWSDPLPAIRVTYRNITKLHFRVVRADWLNRFARDRWNPSQFNEKDRSELANQPRVAEWTTDLSPTDDYREASLDIAAPKGLPSGYYIVLASIKPNFGEENNQVFACDAWVSNLALVVRQSWLQNKPLSGFVLDNRTGEPIAGARVKSISRDYRTERMIEGPSVTTDANGQFVVPVSQWSGYLFVSHKDQTLATQNEFVSREWESNVGVATQVTLFSDRSIYRPGQMIHFKGVAISIDQKNDSYQVVKNQNFRVKLVDINRQEVESIAVKSNDFGSFSGTFTAPRDRGTGSMSIVVEESPQSFKGIQVEEYKRPKFKVDIDVPKESVRLGDTVTVAGKAMAYTGAPIQGARVRYRVVRQVRWPDWFMFCYGWRIAPFLGSSQEIANGWTETKDDGSFECQFVARPDRSIPESEDPIFSYSVTVDVTDGTGETRSDDANVSVGYQAMQIELSADDWQTQEQDVKLRIRSSTFNGEPIASKGSVRVYSLREPEKVLRPDILGQRFSRPQRTPKGQAVRRNTPPTIEPDPADFRNWPLGEQVAAMDLETAESGTQELAVRLKRGLYRCIVESQDRFGKPVKSELNLRVLDENSKTLGLRVPFVFATQSAQVEPGKTWKGIWGSGYQPARAFVEIEHRGNTVKKYWTPADSTQIAIEQPVDESHRGGFTVHVTMVRENRMHTESRVIDVPWSNKQLKIRWDRFRSKLMPGSEETWSVTIEDPNGDGTAAEMVATLYDQSLDAFLPHSWIDRFSFFYRESQLVNASFQNVANGFSWLRGNLPYVTSTMDWRYRSFPSELMVFNDGLRFRMGLPGGARGGVPMMEMMDAMPMAAAAEGMAGNAEFKSAAPGTPALSKQSDGGQAGPEAGPQLDSISPRKNLNETAFFFPQLLSDGKGKVTMQFTMPEALTQWRFLSFAHDQQLRSGSLFDSVVTTKDLMVQPNPPRFLREGDVLEFSVKITNQSTAPQTGTVALHLSDAVDLRDLDAAFENSQAERPFELAPNSSKSLRWKIKVPEGARPVIYKAVAGTEKLSDGEEGMLPVLSNRILVTESLPLPIRGQGTREFELKKLIESAGSTSLRHQSLTVQMTSKPAWYAVLALPYLMEYPYECSEQTFNRFYANALARHVATSDPKIERVFSVWRELQPEALRSPLSKNEDLKSVMIEETPWLRDANDESLARRNVGLLFEKNRLETELQRSMSKLAEMQNGSGLWPWFPGGPDNEYLSLYIVTGFGRLRNMGVQVDESLAIRALDRLDDWMREWYERIPVSDRNAGKNHLSPTIAMYLYGRSFYLVDRPVGEQNQIALKFWQEQARKHWLTLSRQSQAHIAIGMKRMGDRELPGAILKSFKENSVSDDEMGMFWRDTENSWWWYRAPIETQAMMIEAFDEVAADRQAVDDCKVWLLKQKQTQDWKTTKATADAVYALLLRGADWLASDALVQVQVANIAIEPEKVEAGTGFFEKKFAAAEIQPEMGKVKVTKTDAGVSWGSIHWQYLEDIRKVTAHSDTPLKLEKRIYKRRLTEAGPVIEEVTGPVSVGEELVCRIVLRTDRDMEYVHLKDYRGSGTEPVNVLSGYRFQDGLAYYESTRDTATHFFIDYLRKGTYVFEYTLRVQHAGDYPMGLAMLQCMYAPEFNSHSESVQLIVE